MKSKFSSAGNLSPIRLKIRKQPEKNNFLDYEKES